MAEITLDQIKELRERSGAGVMDCKRALEATDGNVDKAIRFLAEQGIAARRRRPTARPRRASSSPTSTAAAASASSSR